MEIFNSKFMVPIRKLFLEPWYCTVQYILIHQHSETTMEEGKSIVSLKFKLYWLLYVLNNDTACNRVRMYYFLPCALGLHEAQGQWPPSCNLLAS